MEEKEVLNTEEAAKLLGCSAYTIREHAKKGLIPGRKLGKEWRFYKPDLLAWLRGKEGKEE
ncbi:MAG: helix-turn-helix domain-containing protein [Desulfobaccales bacterium]